MARTIKRARNALIAAVAPISMDPAATCDRRTWVFDISMPAVRS
jgi:hypothetical protein